MLVLSRAEKALLAQSDSEAGLRHLTAIVISLCTGCRYDLIHRRNTLMRPADFCLGWWLAPATHKYPILTF